ncbi:16S rRNA (uracil(1498)-N(3))-methyltransferase [Desulfolutivibrio sulfoxidireducens]|uniref:16S rRNA (uracil(1498)-N(3))-methyltransferase n=1 Tax=Desulfolutivibrio sulfoxidireducens TaxID=2773299 RepID=UPI00159D59AD|nr:16S rRNA (uracil(1498)-N(3))-methyltransferase [Desulfolutivibrio sulfoxidireducens]QLA16065.1 16S rRNA (uracil(1498)-N(3))-methyltransferase [Desulfolutivibrio sulfoxidireducens]QLA20025.1 16S rRNA (uracil(1498)-N(3))-methyltransferase [Desulfolutivibrio sulfoxidireducens]
MPRLDTFYLPPEGWREPYVLTGGEAGHLARVLRKKAGDRVRVFDGQGRYGEFHIEAVARDAVRLTPLAMRREPEPEAEIWLAIGFAKSARRGYFLEKAVELGARGIIFWQARRSQGKVPAEAKEAWFDQAVAAAKQCGAARLPAILAAPGGAAEVAAMGREYDRRYVLWEAAEAEKRLTAKDMTAPGRVLAVVGPEGGLDDDEVRIFRDGGFHAVSLGNRVLRWETAALAVLSVSLLGPGETS